VGQIGRLALNAGAHPPASGAPATSVSSRQASTLLRTHTRNPLWQSESTAQDALG
jgi:hypothetical protein